MSILTGEVKEVHSTSTFEWTISDFSQLKEPYWYNSPMVEYFGMQWWLAIWKTANDIDHVWLGRNVRSYFIPEPVHFSIQCKTSDGEERVVVRQQKYPERCDWWDLDIDPPWRIPSTAGLTLTCSLRKGDSPHAPGVSRDAQIEGASCSKCRIDEHVNPGSKGVSQETETEDAGSRNYEHTLEGVSRQTRTEDGDGRNDGRHSKDMEKLREKFRLWLQQPQEGGRIRILRREHFQKRPEGDPSSP